VKKIRRAKKTPYGAWEVHPSVSIAVRLPRRGRPVWRRMTTKHEGNVLYFKYWNYWVRAGVNAEADVNRFFRDYEVTNSDIDTLLRDIGFPREKAETEEEIWARIGMVWNWLKDRARDDGAAYSTISSVDGEWPSIADYARYYIRNGTIAWAACFSKAHLFCTLLGRMIYPPYRFTIAEAHHSEGGAPPTATHVYGAAYVAERWFYLDPTAVHLVAFPAYAARKSLGVAGFLTVDYEHPYHCIPVPLSGFMKVPFLPK
jgi:hypothetical protein